MPRPRLALKTDEHGNSTKYCPRCKKDVLTAHYSSCKTTWHGLQVYCKFCQGAYDDRISKPKLRAKAKNPCTMSRRRFTTRGIELFADHRWCSVCTITLDWKSFELRLDLPLSRDGEDLWTNTVILCPDCARIKGLKTVAEMKEQQRSQDVYKTSS